VNNTVNKLLKELSESNKPNISHTIGTVAILIYSRDVFKNNKDLIPFLEKVFNISFLPYVIRSRTLICAKVGRELFSKEEKEIRTINTNLLNYFNSSYEIEDSNKNKKKQKKNANDKLDTWLKGM